jgi:uncharacterized membrane protein (UPF0127 family)
VSRTARRGLGAGGLALGLALAVAALAEQEEPQTALGLAEQHYEQVREAVGSTCTIDRDCPAPLRCTDGACAEPPGIVGTSDADTPMVLFYGAAGEAVYYVEVVDDPQERARGLMYRPSMREDWGMLFVYPAERPLSFWMQNTFIPLDMVFIDSSGTVVGVVENAEPLTTSSRSVPGASQFVVELNAGQAAARGIAAGVRSELLNVPAETISSAVGD